MAAKDGTVAADERGPRISVEQNGRARPGKEGGWHIAWRIRNLEKDAITVQAARLPHGRFKSEERRFANGLAIPRDMSVTLDFAVDCRESPGSVVDNAFLILEVNRLQVSWRIFVRFKVAFNEAGEPETKTELTTVQRVGFSASSKTKDHG